MKIQTSEIITTLGSRVINKPPSLVNTQSNFQDYIKKPEEKPIEEEKKYESKIFHPSNKGVDLKHYEDHMQYMYNQAEPGSYFEKWAYQRLIATEENAFDNAPEFEAVYKRWLAKEDEPFKAHKALLRAQLYAQAGLISYGNQKAVSISPPLEPGDKMQHGLHLINNDLLKQTLMATFEKLDVESVSAISSQLFSYSKLHALDIDHQKENIFQALLDKFGSSIQPMLKDESEPSFDGNINITDEMSMTQQYFIHKTLLQFFEYNLKHFETLIDDDSYNEVEKDMINSRKEAFETLTKNFKNNVDEFYLGHMEEVEKNNF